LFNHRDAAPGLVAVLSHQFWRTRLGADRRRWSTIRIGGKPFEVIGIAPAGFGGLVDRIPSFTAVWVPLSATTMFPRPRHRRTILRSGAVAVICVCAGS
jgi:hypothetical protein